MLLILVSAALAGDCPDARPDADAFHEQVEAVTVLSSVEELDAAQALLDGCIDGPVNTPDLGRLFQARAAVLSVSGGADEDIDAALALAKATGASWDEDFGEELRARYDSLVVEGESTISLDFPEQPPVMVIDGAVVYELGAHSVKPGLHVVQWLGDTGWAGETAQLAAGESASIGAGLAPEPAELAEVPVETPAETRTREPRESSGGGLVKGSASLGYAVANASVSDGASTWSGTVGWPGISAGLSIGRMVHGVVGVETGSLSQDTRPALVSGGRVGVGVGQDGERLEWNAALVGEVALLPVVAAGVGQPSFDQELGFGPGLRAQLLTGGASRFGAELHGAWLLGTLQLGGGFLASFDLGGPVQPMIGLGLDTLRRPGKGSESDRYTWAGLEAGVRFGS